MLVIVQLVGALLVLAPFAAHQFGKLNTDAPAYLWPNLIGSATLAVLASTGGQWGFLLLEAAWATVAARSILRARVPMVHHGASPRSRGLSNHPRRRGGARHENRRSGAGSA